MSTLVIGAAGAALGAGALAAGVRARRAQREAIERLRRRPKGAPDAAERGSAGSILRGRPWIPPVLGGVVLAIWLIVGLPPIWAVSFAVMAGVFAHLALDHLRSGRILRIENQLAEGIDLMVASLSAGAGPLEALESAAQELAEPLAEEFASVAGRIRLGDAPREAFSELLRRVPLEDMQLFTFTLTVHGESGGSLAPTLSTVGESIRDRIELQRNVRSQSAQAQASVLGILAISYFLALLMWRTAPERFEDFIVAPFGASLASGAVLLQALGLVWISRLSKLRF